MPGQYRQQQQRNDVGDFDHGVYCGARGVFVGVAYGVAGYAGLVGFRTLEVFDAFAVDEAVFEALLGVIPGTATSGHGNGHEQACYDHAHEHGAQGREAFRFARDPGDHSENHDW